jgi:hypothetical protein
MGFVPADPAAGLPSGAIENVELFRGMPPFVFSPRASGPRRSLKSL